MIQFTVIGEPTGKQRPKFSTFNGRAVAYTLKKTENYENLVKLSFVQQCGNHKPYDKAIPLKADITAYFAIPKSATKTKRKMMIAEQLNPLKKPDLDNIAKICLDALNGIAYYDDSQIVELAVRKKYSEQPRTEIKIDIML